MPNTKCPWKLNLWLILLFLRPSPDMRYRAFEAFIEFVGEQLGKLGMTTIDVGLKFSLVGITALAWAISTHNHALITTTGASVVSGQLILFALAIRHGIRKVIRPALSRTACPGLLKRIPRSSC